MNTATIEQNRAVLRARSDEMQDERVARAIYAENAHDDDPEDRAATAYAVIMVRFDDAYTESVRQHVLMSEQVGLDRLGFTEGLYVIHDSYFGRS